MLALPLEIEAEAVVGEPVLVASGFVVQLYWH